MLPKLRPRQRPFCSPCPNQSLQRPRQHRLRPPSLSLQSLRPPSLRPRPHPCPADQAYAAARQLLLDGQYVDASNALRDYVTRYGDTAANAPEARYWLGETLYVQDAYAEAAGAYIGALRGWPATPWAPDAVVKLSLSLIALKKPADACSTLDEFARRFPKPAPALAGRAALARTKAQCR